MANAVSASARSRPRGCAPPDPAAAADPARVAVPGTRTEPSAACSMVMPAKGYRPGGAAAAAVASVTRIDRLGRFRPHQDLQRVGRNVDAVGDEAGVQPVVRQLRHQRIEEFRLRLRQGVAQMGAERDAGVGGLVGGRRGRPRYGPWRRRCPAPAPRRSAAARRGAPAPGSAAGPAGAMRVVSACEHGWVGSDHRGRRMAAGIARGGIEERPLQMEARHHERARGGCSRRHGRGPQGGPPASARSAVIRVGRQVVTFAARMACSA